MTGRGAGGRFEGAVAVEGVGVAGAPEAEGDGLCAFWWPGLGVLPLVEAHGVVLDLGVFSRTPLLSPLRK